MPNCGGVYVVQIQLIPEKYWKILETLYDREEEIKIGLKNERYHHKTLARKIGVTEATISEPLSDLKKGGYVKGERKSVYKGGIQEDLILTDEGKIEVIVHQPLQVKTIKSTIRQLKEKLHRMPTVDELACTMGRDPKDSAVRRMIFAVGSTEDWHPPDQMKPSEFDQFEKRVISIKRSKKKS